MKDMKNDSGIRKTFAQFNIQSIILSVLMTLSLVTVTVMGFLLYHRFKLASDKSAVANTEMTVESTIDRLNSSLLDLRQISDAANYNIVQEYDIRNLPGSSVCCMKRIQIKFRALPCMEMMGC